MAEINTVIAEASQDLQTIEDFVNLPAGSDVRPRLLPSVNVGTLAGARQAIFEAGGLPATPFTTKALMTASALVDGKYAMVTDDTVNNGLYVKTAGVWVESRYSAEVIATRAIIESLQFGEAKDNISIKNLESLYDSSTHVGGVYVGAGGVIGGSSTSRMSYMPVESGSSYIMTSTTDGGLVSYLAVSKELTTGIGGELIALPKPAQFKGYSVLKIPDGVDYLYINSKLSGKVLDKDLAIYKIPSSEVYGILGFDFKNKDDAKVVREYLNEIDLSQQKDGLYVWVTGTLRVESASGATLSVMPVKPNTRYVMGIKDSAERTMVRPFFAIGYSNDGDLVSGDAIGNGARLPFSEIEGTNFIEFTTPNDANYIYYTSRLLSNGWDIRENSYIAEIPDGNSVVIPSVNKIGEYAIRDELAHERLSMIQGTYTSPLEGKQWTAIGDSITEHNYRASKNYHDFIKDDVDNLSVVNMGISGSGFYGRHGVANDIVGSPDLITVMFGTNDSPTRGKPRGEFLDEGTDTLNGCINNTMLGLMNNFPESKIAFITSIPMHSRWGVVDDTSGDGYTLVTIADLVVKYCNHYSIPCLDLYRSSGLRPWMSNHNLKYFSSPTSPDGDGVHPNADGHKVIAARIKPFLESLFL